MAIINTIDGGIYPKNNARIVVGTSLAGYTVNDVNYLCDGTADDVEISAAIQALAPDGGEVFLLPGVYNITNSIIINKNNITINGVMGASILNRQYEEVKPGFLGLITIQSNNCNIYNLSLNGANDIYSSSNSKCIAITGSNFCVASNTISNSPGSGIFCYPNSSNSTNYILSNNIINGSSSAMSLSAFDGFVKNNILTNNTTGIAIGLAFNGIISENKINNNEIGISVNALSNSTISNNICKNNSTGLLLKSTSTITENSTISGNVFVKGSGMPSDYTSEEYTILVNGTAVYRNLITNNLIMGKNYVDNSGATSNTFVNNKYN